MNGRVVAVRPIWALIVIGACLVLVSGAGILYTNHTQQAADRRWCSLMRTIDRPLPASPPPSEERRKAANEIHKLRLRLGC